MSSRLVDMLTSDDMSHVNKRKLTLDNTLGVSYVIRSSFEGLNLISAEVKIKTMGLEGGGLLVKRFRRFYQRYLSILRTNTNNLTQILRPYKPTSPHVCGNQYVAFLDRTNTSGLHSGCKPRLPPYFRYPKLLRLFNSALPLHRTVNPVPVNTLKQNQINGGNQ